MKTLLWPLFGLLLLALESVLVHRFGLSLVRIDVTLSLVVFLALRSTLLRGAAVSFVLGYFVDVLTGRPTWLYPFLAVLLFMAMRAAAPYVDRRSRWMFSALVAAGTVGSGLIALMLTVLTSKYADGRGWSLTGLPVQALGAALFASVAYPLLNRFEPAAGSAPVVLKS